MQALLNAIYSEDYLTICLRICGNNLSDAEDLRGEVALMIVDKPPQNIEHLMSSGQIKFYFTRCAKIQYSGNRTRFQKIFGTNKEVVTDTFIDEPIEEAQAPDFSIVDKFVERYHKALSEIKDEFERELFKLWVSEKNCVSISRKTGIKVHRVREYTQHFPERLKALI